MRYPFCVLTARGEQTSTDGIINHLCESVLMALGLRWPTTLHLQLRMHPLKMHRGVGFHALS